MGTDWSFPALASLQMVVLLVASIWTTCETRSRRSSGPLALSLNLAGDLQQLKMVSLSIKERVWSSSKADSMRRWMEASMGLLSLKSANPARRRDLKSKRPSSPLPVEPFLQVAGNGLATGLKMGFGQFGWVAPLPPLASLGLHHLRVARELPGQEEYGDDMEPLRPPGKA